MLKKLFQDAKVFTPMDFVTNYCKMVLSENSEESNEGTDWWLRQWSTHEALMSESHSEFEFEFDEEKWKVTIEPIMEVITTSLAEPFMINDFEGFTERNKSVYAENECQEVADLGWHTWNYEVKGGAESKDGKGMEDHAQEASVDLCSLEDLDSCFKAFVKVHQIEKLVWDGLGFDCQNVDCREARTDAGEILEVCDAEYHEECGVTSVCRIGIMGNMSLSWRGMVEVEVQYAKPKIDMVKDKPMVKRERSCKGSKAKSMGGRQMTMIEVGTIDIIGG
ncbi:hypothetical protein VNO78_10997 [Psophocarpus tetragonolobus]|uniref:Uncharacterized protein n=1 Tax=Psophocarpus tetragonolobus TaxID=3891 RepID=A0AAN9XN92_PSOTE